MKDIKDIEECVNSFLQECRDDRPHDQATVSPILFRGHSNESWELKTTLERFGKENLGLNEYIDYLSLVKPSIESLTKNNFLFTRRNDYDPDCTFPLSGVRLRSGEYEFTVYLRHHGFPTPLLDWSKSLYVALYFACSSNTEQKADAALHMFANYPGYSQSGFIGMPEIKIFNPYVSTHKRHFFQQSMYTACISEIHNSWCYVSHQTSINPEKHKYFKLIIPEELKIELLKKLDYMNINAFSLFGTEEALMQTLAFRELNK